jgi:O-antigen/teichoic acid export membrane protein
MKEFKGLFRQSSVYFGGSILHSLAGLISFPLWTRALTPSEYGTYSLLNISVFFLAAFSKSGLQHSAIRYFSEFATKKRAESIASFYTTHIAGTVVSSLILNAIFILVVSFSSAMFDGVESLPLLVGLVCLLALVDSLMSILHAFMRVEQRAKQYTGWGFVERYLGIGLSVLLLLVFDWGLVGLIAGQLISSSFVVTVLLSRLVLNGHLNLRSVSTTYLKDALKYGAPMIPVESSRLVLELGDRYLIQFFMGAAAVGLYSVGYNITTYIRQFVAMPLNRAIAPVYLDMWEKRGADETKKFLEVLLQYYLMVAIPLIFTISYFSEDIIRILASAKYVEVASIVPLIIAPVILYGANGIFSAGLIIHKKTKTMMYAALSSALLNVALNLLLIPTMGLKGAALATMFSYSVLILTLAHYSFKLLPLSINSFVIAGYVAAAFVMFGFFRFFEWQTLFGLALRVAGGLGIYAICLTVVDSRIRKKVIALF